MLQQIGVSSQVRTLTAVSPSYRIYRIGNTGLAIECHRCGLVSHNRTDVAYRYCGRCCVFFDDIDGNPFAARA